MISRFSPLLAVLLIVILLAACNAVDDPDPDLDGTSWYVLEINGEPIPAEIEITVIFSDETLGGEAPCNIYTSEYSQDGNKINIESPIMTQLYCEEENVMEVEEAFTSALVSVRKLDLEDDYLLMKDEGDRVLLQLGK